MSDVTVLDYDPNWPRLFETLRSSIWDAISDVAISIEHVGSTAVPGLAAKPVIDIDVVVHEVAVRAGIARLEALGYRHRGDCGVPKREAFRSPAGSAPHHLYLCASTSVALANHLAIRDYLRANPPVARSYGDLKQRLACDFADDRIGYVEAKTAFLVAILREAGFAEDDLAEIVQSKPPPADGLTMRAAALDDAASFSGGAQMFPEMATYRIASVGTGKSASCVFRLTYPGKQALYLKTAAAPHVAELEAEHERLLWLEGRAPVPEVVAFKSSPHQAALLTRALPGANAIEVSKENWSAVVRRLAEALREMHAIATADCPFDRRLAVVIESARGRTMAGLVDESDFDEERRNLRARDLLLLLEQQQPAAESPVITHGDACLPNVIFEGSDFRGFVDCGRSGLSDAYQDLALASRSIASNYGPEYVDHFFEAYGLREVDAGKLAYYRLADEFF